MKKMFYAVMVFVSAFFLVNAGMSETETLGIIPDYKKA